MCVRLSVRLCVCASVCLSVCASVRLCQRYSPNGSVDFNEILHTLSLV